MNVLIVLAIVILSVLLVGTLILSIQCLGLFIETAKLYLKDNEEKLLQK